MLFLGFYFWSRSDQFENRNLYIPGFFLIGTLVSALVSVPLNPKIHDDSRQVFGIPFLFFVFMQELKCFTLHDLGLVRI